MSEIKPLELLIVEDHDMNREIFEEFARDYGANVTAVRDGIEALASYFERLKQGKPYDAIITDLSMPRKDELPSGGDLIVEIVKRVTPQTQVIFITGGQDDARYKRLMETVQQADPDAILQKPISRDDFTYVLSMVDYVRATRLQVPTFKLQPSEYRPIIPNI
ncbi:response regulator [Candidatus Woesearchaeota archaeon]|nr:response regulator [Candidatus Pacearchaeota archaeon]MBI4452210.1 response regulator [Candidatus Woesearchaeota archaeon]